MMLFFRTNSIANAKKNTIRYSGRATGSSFNKFRRILISILSLSAYFVSTLGFGDNLVYLCIAFGILLIGMPFIYVNRCLYWAIFTLLLAVFWGGYKNGLVPALRSATPYIGLIVAFGLLDQGRQSNGKHLGGGIALLYIFGLIQLIIYIARASMSPNYAFLYSLDEFHRLSPGWIPILAFFHASLPNARKNGLRHSLRLLGFVFWTVPLLVILNSSRSELLITALLIGVSLFIRWRLLFVGAILLVLATFPILTNNIYGIERVSRSIEEVFTTDLYTISDAYTNYRAFENLMMIERIVSDGPFGCGLGCEVPFSTKIILNEQEYDGVTVFHNGYLAVLLHFGVAGLAIIGALVSKLIQAWKLFSSAYQRRGNFGAMTMQCEGLRLAVLVVLVGTGLTTGGFMSSYDVLVLLMPLCSAIGAAEGGVVSGIVEPIRVRNVKRAPA